MAADKVRAVRSDKALPGAKNPSIRQIGYLLGWHKGDKLMRFR